MARPRTILFADADHDIVRFVTLILENEGYRVVVARDGDEALEKARAARPDLLLMEILLPRRNGYQVCRAIKADPVLKTLPVVFLSAKSQASDRFWARRVGCDGFVAKPFDPGELVHELHTHLSDRPPVVV